MSFFMLIIVQYSRYRCFFARFNGKSMHIEPANSCEHHDCSHIDVVVCSNKSNINLKQQVSETELKNSRCDVSEVLECDDYKV